MYVLKKKAVILFIAICIFFIGTIININQKYESGVIDIAIVSPDDLQYQTSDTSFLTKDVSNVIATFNQDETGINKISSTNYQIENDKLKDKKFVEAVEYNDILFVVGDQFNEIIQLYIDENPKKEFVLVNNSSEITAENVCKVNFDYEDLFNKILKDQNPTKILYITNSENNNDFENEYNTLNSIYNNGDNIKMIDARYYDNIELENEIKKYLDIDYNFIISNDNIDNSIIINTIESYNNKVTENINLKDEITAENIDQTTEDKDQPKVDEALDYTEAKLFALGEINSISENNENIIMYEVSYEDAISSIISNYFNETKSQDYIVKAVNTDETSEIESV